MEFDKLAFFDAIGYQPHPGQMKLHLATARYRILACGSRWGKSTAASREAMAAMMKPDSLGWVVGPTYDLASIVFREIMYGWLKARPDFVEDYSETRGYMRLINGAECYAKSADNPASLLGRGLDWLIPDECALMQERVWQEFLQARLIEKKGWAMFTSTPKGKGWFYQLFLRGKDAEQADYYSQEGATWENPIVDKEALLKNKPNWTKRYWDQEVLGHFIEESGAVFRNIRGDHLSGDFQEPSKGHSYVAGVDLAKHQDWTVITVLDETGHVVCWERLDQGTGWPTQKMRIASISTKYNGATCYVDSSGVGDPIVDDLGAMGVPVMPVPTAQQKTQLIDALVVAMDNNKITYPEIPVLLNELEIFEHEKTGTGRDKYGAPSGMHDDAVISLALAWRGVVGEQEWFIPTKGFG